MIIKFKRMHQLIENTSLAYPCPEFGCLCRGPRSVAASVVAAVGTARRGIDGGIVGLDRGGRGQADRTRTRSIR